MDLFEYFTHSFIYYLNIYYIEWESKAYTFIADLKSPRKKNTTTTTLSKYEKISFENHERLNIILTCRQLSILLIIYINYWMKCTLLSYGSIIINYVINLIEFVSYVS